MPSVGGGPLPLSASGGNAPACGGVEAVGPSTRQTREERADSNIRMTFAACEGFERSDGRWIICPRSGERFWVKSREESIRIKKLWSEESQESHHSTPASGGNAPARGNQATTSSASGRYVPACGGGAAVLRLRVRSLFGLRLSFLSLLRRLESGDKMNTSCCLERDLMSSLVGRVDLKALPALSLSARRGGRLVPHRIETVTCLLSNRLVGHPVETDMVAPVMMILILRQVPYPPQEGEVVVVVVVVGMTRMVPGGFRIVVERKAVAKTRLRLGRSDLKP